MLVAWLSEIQYQDVALDLYLHKTTCFPKWNHFVWFCARFLSVINLALIVDQLQFFLYLVVMNITYLHLQLDLRRGYNTELKSELFLMWYSYNTTFEYQNLNPSLATFLAY